MKVSSPHFNSVNERQWMDVTAAHWYASEEATNTLPNPSGVHFCSLTIKMANASIIRLAWDGLIAGLVFPCAHMAPVDPVLDMACLRTTRRFTPTGQCGWCGDIPPLFSLRRGWRAEWIDVIEAHLYQEERTEPGLRCSGGSGLLVHSWKGTIRASRLQSRTVTALCSFIRNCPVQWFCIRSTLSKREFEAPFFIQHNLRSRRFRLANAAATIYKPVSSCAGGWRFHPLSLIVTRSQMKFILLTLLLGVGEAKVEASNPVWSAELNLMRQYLISGHQDIICIQSDTITWSVWLALNYLIPVPETKHSAWQMVKINGRFSSAPNGGWGAASKAIVSVPACWRVARLPELAFQIIKIYNLFALHLERQDWNRLYTFTVEVP